MGRTFRTVLFLNFCLFLFGLTPAYGLARQFFSRLSYPLESNLYNLNVRFLGGLKIIFELPRAAQENTDLKKQVLILKETETKYYLEKREIDLLRAQLKLGPPAKDRGFILAHVLRQKASEGLLQIDAGQVQGIKDGDLVTIPGVLVGRVSQVRSYEAEVLMTVSSKSHLEAANASLLARGEAVGNFGSQMIFGKVLPSQSLNAGETIIDFSSRLILGIVQTVRESGTNIFKEAVVTVGYDPSQITEVFVTIQP